MRASTAWARASSRATRGTRSGPGSVAFVAGPKSTRNHDVALPTLDLAGQAAEAVHPPPDLHPAGGPVVGDALDQQAEHAFPLGRQQDLPDRVERGERPGDV